MEKSSGRRCLEHRASLESALVSWMHRICCDNMNAKSVYSAHQFYKIFTNLETRLSFLGTKTTKYLVPNYPYLVVLVPRELL